MSSAGQGSLSSAPRTRPIPPPGPPFPINSADNGLSVDPVTGHIVLGSDIGTPVPGQLLSNREIDLNNFDFFFSSGGGIVNAYLTLSPSTGTFFFGDNFTGDNLFIDTINSNATISCAGGRSLVLNNNLFTYDMGDVDALQNGTTFTIDDTNQEFLFGGSGGLRTSTPNGPGTDGAWLLGKFTAGPVALDATNFILANVDGVVRKILVST